MSMDISFWAVFIRKLSSIPTAVSNLLPCLAPSLKIYFLSGHDQERKEERLTLKPVIGWKQRGEERKIEGGGQRVTCLCSSWKRRIIVNTSGRTSGAAGSGATHPVSGS